MKFNKKAAFLALIPSLLCASIALAAAREEGMTEAPIWSYLFCAVMLGGVIWMIAMRMRRINSNYKNYMEDKAREEAEKAALEGQDKSE